MALGYDGRLFLLPLVGSAVDVLLDVVEHTRTVPGVGSGEVAVLVDGRADHDLARHVKARGMTLALPADDRTQERFAFADEDDFAGPITDLEPDLNAVRLRWHPDDAPETKKAQALGLTKLGAWLHETDRTLLVELAVPPTDGDLGAVDGDAGRYAREVRPGRICQAIREIRELGVEADLWSVAGSADRKVASTLGALVRDAGRDQVTMLARLEADAHTEDVVRASAAVAAYRGLGLEPDLWADELGALDAGERAREDVVRTIGARVAHLIDLYTAAQPA